MNMDKKTEHVLRYITNVISANNETAKKELLKGLLIRLFSDDADAQKIIDKMSLGAERTISHYKADKVPSGFDLAAWTAEHNLLLL